MKSKLLTIVALMTFIGNSYADINCSGRDVGTGRNVTVEVSGNPLEISYSFNPGWGKLLVDVLENNLIQGENDTYGNQPRVRGELEHNLRLAGGNNARLTLRTFDNYSNNAKKNVILLKCKGRVTLN
ncbi:hypothetical protein [Peredibacter starrii]|uniref:Secreted protein n=1 Tax=Peredibacter starrii TaxID=28202 RepID=A0AAX4HT87_9BACT|nr:hypothetical protein [Peredibacter starrii]WPU66416.1 hypothetical protein SOO65_06625 [Peredibacter starrii]